MYVNKKAEKKRLPRKTLLFMGAAAIAVTVFLTGLIVILTTPKDLQHTILDLPEASGYFPVGNTIIYPNEELLTCSDKSLKDIWKLRLFSGGLDFTVNDSLIAATGQGVIQVLDANGEHLFSMQIDGEILSARVGKNMVAVCAHQQADGYTPSYIIVFSISGEELFRQDVTDRYVLDYGFNEDSDALYLLELDVSGSAPVSRISTYRPDTQAITFIKEFRDQLVSDVYWIGDSLYAVGTNQLVMYNSIDSSDKKVTVYGWVLEDVYTQDDPRFVYVPAGSDEHDIARIIRSSGNEITINLPPGIFKILYQRDKIYCFANNQLFVYTGEGKYLRTYDLPYEITGVERAISNYVFLNYGDTVSLMPLP